MAIHRRYGPRDEEDQAIGDSGFLGVNDRADPRQLPEGMCPSAVNKSFENGVAETRPGWMTPSWGGGPGLAFDSNYDGVEEGINFDPDGDGVEEGVTFEPMGFGTVFGRLVFSDPNGQEATLLAVWNGVWRIRSLSEPELIALPENQTITKPVRFVQTFDKVLMLRGEQSTLQWDPQETFEDGIGAFEEIEQTAPGSGSFLSATPPSDDAICYANRAWFKLNGYRDQLGVSDILDYTHCDLVLNKLRVNAGTDDEIVRMLPYAGRMIVVLKRRSGYVLDGVWAQDLSEMVTCDRLSGCPGCVGPDAAAEMGKDVVFLGDGNVWTVSQTEEGKLQASDKPLSHPIKHLMKRIHWAHAHIAQMQVFGDRLYLAVPLDGVTFNNAILVYNSATGQWEGYWTAPWLRLVSFAVITENQAQRLAFVNGVGGRLKLHWWAELSVEDRQDLAQSQMLHEVIGLTDGALCVMGAGKQDVVYGYSSWIEDEIVTRGYNLGPLQQIRSVRVTLDNETWNPRYSVFVRGCNQRGEEAVAVDVRRGFERTTQYFAAQTPSQIAWLPQSFSPGSTGWQRTCTGTALGGWEGWRLAKGDYVDIWYAPTGSETDLNVWIWPKFYVAVYVDTPNGSAYPYFTAQRIDSNSILLCRGVIYGTPDEGTLDNMWPSATHKYVGFSSRWRLTFTDGEGDYAYFYGVGLFSGTNRLPGRRYFTDVVNSRRQRIFRQPEVLWSDGVAPVDINGVGHDDYAWRLGAGMGNGVVLGATHRLPEDYLVSRRGDFLQVRIAGERGFSALHGVRVDAQTGRRGLRT
jgi:hypothetical protein